MNWLVGISCLLLCYVLLNSGIGILGLIGFYLTIRSVMLLTSKKQITNFFTYYFLIEIGNKKDNEQKERHENQKPRKAKE